jgi:hypothetical protein
MSKALMPQFDRRSHCGGEDLWERRPERVEIAGAVTAVNHRAGGNVLYRKARGIKLNGNIVVTG